MKPDTERDCSLTRESDLPGLLPDYGAGCSNHRPLTRVSSNIGNPVYGSIDTRRGYSAHWVGEFGVFIFMLLLMGAALFWAVKKMDDSSVQKPSSVPQKVEFGK